MTTQPSPEYRRHHDVDEPRIDVRHFRQAWRVHARLDALAASGRISRGEFQAAIEFRNACSRLQVSIGADGRFGIIRTVAGGDAHARQIALLDTTTRLAALRSTIGVARYDLCYACAVYDLSWHEIGRRCCCHHETARDRTVDALGKLAQAWAG